MNLGNPTELTVLELAQVVLELTGSSSRIVHKALPADDPTRRRPDITRAERLLGWVPTVDPSDGLARTVEWFQSRLRLGVMLPTDPVAMSRSKNGNGNGSSRRRASAS